MSYLKIESNVIVEAPYSIQRNHRVIYGYNKENNQAMLFEDGYRKYQYSKDKYKIVENQIVEKEQGQQEIQPSQEEQVEQVVEKTVFSKLQIRRAMRKLKLEYVLDDILTSNQQFKKDWTDAQEIDLNDQMIQNVINDGIISEYMINQIKDVILESKNEGIEK